MAAAAKKPIGEGFSEPKAKPSPRINVRDITDRSLDRRIFALGCPPVQILLRGYFGPNWAKELSRRHRWHIREVYSATNGTRALPRYFLQDIVDEWGAAGSRAAWEREQRAEFERQLKRRIERRQAIVRWSRLLLSGAAALPGLVRFRKFGYAGMERNFLGSGDK